ncbi:MAG: potassium transporter TrkG [Anaerovoracaceae bacterium]
MTNITFNYRVIGKILGLITLITGISMLPALACANIYKETSVAHGLFLSSIFTMLIGMTLFISFDSSKAKFRPREGYMIVAFSWILVSIFGALPYYLSGFTDSIANAFFESTAGFTTTGCTVTGESIMPKSLLLWKAISHWLGGMGILVFAVSILSALGVNGRTIARAETPGPVLQKMAVHMSDSAKILYLMYFSFTVLEFILLTASPKMGTFDAIINTMGSISTAGLSAHPNGIGHYDSVYIEIIISCFTVLASLNFVLYYYMFKRKFGEVFADVELRSFLRILIVGILICAAGLYFQGDYTSFPMALRDASFQIVSFGTTSGYASVNYVTWPSICKLIMFTMFFIGGCSASTCGSIKVIRVLVFFKLIWRGFYRRIHPRSVVAVKLQGKAVPAPIVSAITVFILMYMTLFLFSCLVLSLQNLDLETTVSSAAAMLSNTGLAFGQIGASANYGLYSAPLKVYLSFLMIVGRLELFTIIILFTRNFWGKSR